MPHCPDAHARVMGSPRSRTAATASANVSTPAPTAAAKAPTECPATMSGRSPCHRSACGPPRLREISSASCAFVVDVSASAVSRSSRLGRPAGSRARAASSIESFASHGLVRQVARACPGRWAPWPGYRNARSWRQLADGRISNGPSAVRTSTAVGRAEEFVERDAADRRYRVGSRHGRAAAERLTQIGQHRQRAAPRPPSGPDRGRCSAVTAETPCRQGESDAAGRAPSQPGRRRAAAAARRSASADGKVREAGRLARQGPRGDRTSVTAGLVGICIAMRSRSVCARIPDRRLARCAPSATDDHPRRLRAVRVPPMPDPPDAVPPTDAIAQQVVRPRAAHAFRCRAIVRTSRRGSPATPCGSSGRLASRAGSTDPAARCGRRRSRRRRPRARRDVSRGRVRRRPDTGSRPSQKPELRPVPDVVAQRDNRLRPSFSSSSTVRRVMRAAAALCMAWISTPGSSRARICWACRPCARNPPDSAVPDHDGHHRVTGVAGAVVRVDGGGDGLVQPGHLLDAAVGLAGQVDDGDDGPLARRGGVRGDDVVDRRGQCPGFGRARPRRSGRGGTGSVDPGTTAR